MVFGQAVLPCITRDCTFGVLVLPIFQQRVPVSTLYIVTFILTKDIGVLVLEILYRDEGRFIDMMGRCEERKMATNMGVLLQER